ncbi:ATP-binding protein [Neorickettsia risticii]
MKSRYTDGIKKNKLNFVIRYPRRFFLVFILMLLQFLCGAQIVLEFNSIGLLGVYEIKGLFYAFGIIIFFLLTYNLKKLHLVLAAAEFQNMFYSNAAKALTEFYLIITNNGEVVYRDERTKVKNLQSLLREKYEKFISDIREGVLYHRFSCDGQVIEIIPMIRPKGYFIVAARRVGEREIYDVLLREAGVSLYSVKGDSLKYRGARYFEEVSYKKTFLEDELYRLTEVFLTEQNRKGLFLQNYRRCLNDTHYGVLVPKLKEIRELADNASIGIVLMSNDLEIISANDAFFDIFEKGDQIKQFLRDKLSDLKRGDGPSIFNFSTESGDSARLYLSNYGILNAGFLVDLSELSDLQKKFQHSQKIVSLGELSGGIAHDFNNILTAIMGFAEILLEDVRLESKHYYNIAQIRYSAKKGRDLVKKILAFSRKQTLHPEVLSMAEVVKSMRQFVERLVPENIKLTFVIRSGLKNVRVDRTEIEQSLINLIVNARDAIEACGEITVEIAETFVNKKYVVLIGTQNEEVVLKGEYISLTVRDNGCGMNKEILSKIFDPFFSTKSVDKGTGLGLSTVYGIMKQMKGYINVESTEGQGSVFTLLIPVSYEDISNDAKKVDEDLVPSEKSKGAKILLVEDEKIVRNFLVKALTRQGFSVIEYESSKSALEKFEEEKDTAVLLITDVVMPGMDGPEMVKEMRKQKADLKVLFMSGYTRDKLHLDSKNRDEIFIAKPFGINELISKVISLTEDRGQSA